MYLSVCGFNHKSANLQDREPYQIPRGELAEAVSSYKELSGAEEAVIVSTCNRVEFYRVLGRKSNQYEELIRFYQSRGLEDASILRDICYSRQGTTAARHLFRVVSGLDSLVLGEDQVIHQVKEAYSAACAAGGPGRVLHKLFHLAFGVSKRVRSETRISSGPRNIPCVALELLEKKMGEAQIRRAMVVGVNNLAEILLERFRRRKIPTILANRTFYHAEKMAGGYGAEPASLERLTELLPTVDAVLTVAAAEEFIITLEHLNGIDAREGTLFIMDLAIPRNVDPAVSEHSAVKLLDLQDLKRHLDVTASRRKRDIPKAEEIIEEQVNAYSLWKTKTLRADRLLLFREAMNRARLAEMDKFKEGFRKGDLKALDAFSVALMREYMRFATYLIDEDDIPMEFREFQDISKN